MNDKAATQPGNLGVITVTGVDAKSFLQGQVSFDMGRLTPGYVELASVNSPQGRVQAVVWLVERTDAILLLLAAELVETTVARLRKFVLRAKARIDVGTNYVITTPGGESMPTAVRGHTERDGMSVIHWPGSRGLVIRPSPDSGRSAPFPLVVDLAQKERVAEEWHLEDIRAGLPQVFKPTHEAFVAQMLNLDLLQGISFDKGCYTGQEIIARMHFRGQVKRRMLRFALAGPPPAPGTRVVNENNHAGDVVDAAATADGCELLAVISLSQREEPLHIDGQPGASLRPLPLPYQSDLLPRAPGED